jgi:hypothetical protein
MESLLADPNRDQNLRERVALLEQTVIHYQRDRGELRQAIDELTMEIRQQFEGRDGRPGIVMRIDRLEQIEVRRAKVVWLTFSTALAALATAMWEHLFGARH